MRCASCAAVRSDVAVLGSDHLRLTIDLEHSASHWVVASVSGGLQLAAITTSAMERLACRLRRPSSR